MFKDLQVEETSTGTRLKPVDGLTLANASFQAVQYRQTHEKQNVSLQYRGASVDILHGDGTIEVERRVEAELDRLREERWKSHKPIAGQSMNFVESTAKPVSQNSGRG